MNRAVPAPKTWEYPSNLLDDLLNRLMALNDLTARLRSLLILLPFFAIWPLFAYMQNGEALRFSILGLIRPEILPAGSEPLGLFFSTAVRALFAPGVLIHVLALYLPPILALWATARYIGEIYELKDPAVARRFISQAAFHLPRYERLVINTDQVSRDTSPSTIMQIGGPGYLQVNLEYAAVFEKVSGAPDLIGPTAGKRGNCHTLEGLERFRTVLDLRDQFFRIDQLSARTREGVRVNLQNVQLIFSIQREKDAGGLQNPYPFSRAAVHRLVYRQLPEEWTQTMIDLVTQELVRYIRSRSLGDLLAAVGEPEINRQIELETAVRKQTMRRRMRLERYRQHKQRPLVGISNRRVLQRIPAGWGSRPKRIRPPHRPHVDLYEQRSMSSITPRVQLTNFFSDFVEGFPRRAHQHGVSLRWINVGTFHTTQEVVPGQHIEAWQLNANNLARSSPPVLNQLRSQAYRQELARLLNGLWEKFDQSQKLQPEERIAAMVVDLQHRVRSILDDPERSVAVPEDVRRGLERMEQSVESYRSPGKVHL